MIRPLALAAMSFIAGQSIGSEAPAQGDYPTVGLVFNSKEDHGLRYDCALEQAGELVCDFIQTSVRPKLSEKDATKSFARLEEDLKPERFESAKKETCQSYREFREFILGAKPAPDPEALAKQLTYRAAREASESWLALGEKFCQSPTSENYRALARFNIQVDQRTCQISVNPFRQRFKAATSGPAGAVWVVDSKPEGACGVVQLTRFERVKPFRDGFETWVYVARKAVTNPRGRIELPVGQVPCSELDESEYLYDWRKREIGLGCDFIEFSAL